MILSHTSIPAAGQGFLKQTTSTTPDLSGIWDFRTLIPLERPTVFEGKEFLTEEEAAEFEKQTIQVRNNDNGSSNLAADVEGAYNEFWRDWGSDLTDNRTSLIIDPADDRVPH